jgi:hypothetical protein
MRASSAEFVGPFWLDKLSKPMESLGETGSSPRMDRMVARCKVAGTGQESPISFNSQP